MVEAEEERDGSGVGPERRIRLSLRLRLVLVLLAIGAAVWFLLAAALVYTARERVHTEIASSFAIADRYLRAKSLSADSSPTDAGQWTRLGGEGFRHVRISVVDQFGNPVAPPAEPGPHRPEADRAPAWYAALVDTGAMRRSFPVWSGGRHGFRVVLESRPDDEIADSWKDFRLAMSATALHTVLLIAAAVALLQVLTGRLDLVHDGLRRLEAGGPAGRLRDPGLEELAPIAARIGTLAAALAAREAENRQLTRRLLAIQDEERHGIAHELHDELGPYLFGARAAADELARGLATGGAGRHEGKYAALGETAARLCGLIQTIQTRTRRLISALKPMSLGESSLADLVEDAVAGLRRIAPDSVIAVRTGTGERRYGDAVDLTVHRFVEEGILNALRHGRARTISVDVTEADDVSGSRLAVVVADDGVGPGYGLRGLSSRIAALGGRLEPPRREAGRTLLAMVLPLDGPDGPAPISGDPSR